MQRVEVNAIEDFYGMVQDMRKDAESGYILFYETVD